MFGIHTGSFLGVPNLESAHLEINGLVSATVRAAAAYAASVSADETLLVIPLGIYTVGPIVLTPNFKFVAGVEASLDAGISAEASGSWSVLVGVMCDGGCEAEHIMSQSIDGNVTLSAGAMAKAFLRPELELGLYDTVGGHVGLQPFLKLDADLTADPWWTLRGGVEGDVGLSVSLLGHDIGGYDASFTIFDLPIGDAQGEPPPPPQKCAVRVEPVYHACHSYDPPLGGAGGGQFFQVCAGENLAYFDVPGPQFCHPDQGDCGSGCPADQGPLCAGGISYCCRGVASPAPDIPDAPAEICSDFGSTIVGVTDIAAVIAEYTSFCQFLGGVFQLGHCR